MVSLSLHLKQLWERLLNINREGDNSEGEREEEDRHSGTPGGAGGGDKNHPSDGGGSEQIGNPHDAGTPKVTTSPGAGASEVTTSPLGSGTSRVSIPPPPKPAEEGGSEGNHESDGDGSKLTPGTPPDAATAEVITSPLGAGTAKVTTPAKQVQSLADEFAAPALLDRDQPPAQSLADELAAAAGLGGEQTATQLIESWADESQDLKETDVSQSSFK